MRFGRNIAVALAIGLVVFLFVVRRRLGVGAMRMRSAEPLASAAAPPPGSTRSAGCRAGATIPDDGPFATASGRRLLVYGPHERRADVPAPLLVVFHGIGDDPVHFADWFAMHERTGGRALVVYPGADPHWDIRGTKDVTFASELVAAVAARWCVDPTRVFAFGFSWGGKLVSRLACSETSPFAAFGVGDGSLHEHVGERACPARSVFVTVRTHDEDERPEWGREAARSWAKSAHCADVPAPVRGEPSCVAWSGCAEGRRVVLCEDAFFDPAWPKSWNHTVRPEQLDLAWRWFEGALP